MSDAGDKADELNDFTSGPVHWLVNKLSDRSGRAFDAVRAAASDEITSRVKGYLAVAVLLAIFRRY